MTHKRCSLHRQNRPHPCRYRTSTTSFWFAANFLICLGIYTYIIPHHVLPEKCWALFEMRRYIPVQIYSIESIWVHRYKADATLLSMYVYSTWVCVYGALLMLPWSNFVCSTTGFISLSYSWKILLICCTTDIFVELYTLRFFVYDFRCVTTTRELRHQSHFQIYSYF